MRYGWGDLAYLLRRWWARMAVVGVLVFAAVSGGLLWQAPGSTARVRLVVEPAAGLDDGRAARNQAELLRDPGLVRGLAPRLMALQLASAHDWRERLGLGARPADAAALAGRVSAALRVEAVGDTDVVALALRWPDRVFAARALDVIVGQYRRAAGAAVAGRAQLAAAGAALGVAEAELAAAEAQPMEDAAVLDSAQQRGEARLGAARAQADGVRLERALGQRRLDALEARFKAGGWVEEADAQADAGASAGAAVGGGFAALLEKRQALLGAGKADSAAVRAIDREIARVRQENYAFARQGETDRMAALDDRLGVLTASIGDGAAALRALDRRAADAAVARGVLQAKARRLGAARLALEQARAAEAAGWQAAGVGRVVSSAAAAEADWPGAGPRLGLAACLGVLAAFGSAVWAESRRLTIDRPGDISRKLGLEVLARLEDVRVVQLR